MKSAFYRFISILEKAKERNNRKLKTKKILKWTKEKKRTPSIGEQELEIQWTSPKKQCKQEDNGVK